MTEQNENFKEVVAVCNEFMDSKILFADRKIQKILEAIASDSEVYGLIGECLSSFNRDKEFDKAFTVSSTGKGYFVMPKEEFKVIALVFCLLADINSCKCSFDEIVSKYFVNEEGKKDYALFMQKVIVPFRNLIAEAFGSSLNVTTVEGIEGMKEQEDEIESEQEEDQVGKPRFHFRDTENLERTFELAKNIALQMYDLLIDERKQTEAVRDGLAILNSIIIACNKEDFEMLNGLVLGLKYELRAVKNLRFLNKELLDVVQSQIYCN